MKKKRIFTPSLAVLMLAVAVLLVALLPACNHLGGTAQNISITEDCWKHVTDCKIVEQEDGSASVVLTAPDYVRLVNQLAEETTEEVTGDMLAQAVENNPQAVKEYSFVAVTSKDEDVRAALMEQISYELVALTLADMNG